MRHAQDIPAALVNLRLSVAENFGANRELLIKDSGIDSDLLSHPSNRVPVEDVLNGLDSNCQCNGQTGHWNSVGKAHENDINGHVGICHDEFFQHA